ncbi:Gfo/Idh/MocA family oxidoreductase [Paenibacillus frigoriresistens]|uniref:Gfo/Idh/MocA family protein n=1 Tax=Paenibacillus alginolyticus TaxID=59839 RepID=UPI0015657994|nr:Gfo/Idh/MocA family oxidoreductase [Paenibacillus frigoriresistens]NRF95728.1 Gfo/Idh/MocA family oxidoreductase [Paenibacillus frigoriresistens]
MKIRVGFVGVGGIADVHLSNLSKNAQVELVALCDIAEEIVRGKAAQYGAKAYTDANRMLDCEKLDALFLCVPPFAHGDLEEKAAVRGIHLFVEKPLGLDMDVVRNKAEVIRKAGIINGSGYCLRYLDTVAKAKQYLLDKEIAMVRAHYITSFVPTTWWRDGDKSGGQLVEQSTHTVDLVRYLAGDVRKLYANMELRVMKDIPDLNIPDVGTVSLVFASGAIGHMDTSFTQHDHRTGVEILGRDFRLIIDGTNLSIVDKERTITYNSRMDFYREQDNAFVEALVSQRPELILAPYTDAMKTLEVTLAANESARTGLPITL